MLLARVGTPWKSPASARRGIGLRLLVGVVLFSSVITLVLTALELYLQYSHDVGVIERRLDDIEQASLRAIGESLWHLDAAQLRVQLEGILRLPDIRAIEVRETTSANPFVLSFGERQSSAVVARDLPVVYGEGSAARQIGSLHVEATLTDVYRTLRNRVIVILINQGTKTFLVSFFLIFLFHRLVTRHLVSIADYLRDYDFRAPAQRLRLQRRAPSEPDELDRTVAAFNELLASQAAISLENSRLYGDLQEREAKIRRLVDSNIIGICIWQLEGQILEANDEFLRIVGCDREDLISGRIRWTDLTPPEWRARDARLVQEIKRTGALPPFEKEYFRKDGSRVPVLLGSAAFDESGNAGVSFVLDLTGRKQAEYLTRQVFESSIDGISIIGRDYRYKRVNRAYERYFEMPVESIVGKHLTELRDSRIFEQTIKPNLDRCFAGEEVSYAEWFTDPRGRRYVAVTYSPLRLESDRVDAALATDRDLTDYLSVSEALERSEHRYRHLFRDMPVALWQLDALPLIALFNDMRAKGVEDLSTYIDEHPDFLRHAGELSIIEETNDYAVQMFGARDQRELLGPMQWVWRESPDTLRRAIESRFRGEELFQETTKLPTFDGRVIDVLYTVSRPQTSDKLGTTLISLVDLTEGVRAQEMLQRVQAELAHAARLSMLGELTASIAHELNQPLAAITTSGEAGLRWLDRSVPNLAKVRTATTRMIADARRSADIIARIRGMAVRRAPERKPVSLDELILETIGFLRQEAQSRAITISHQPAPGAPKVLADRIQLQQVIVNLAVNAMQAIAQAGSPERKITIRTTMPDAATLCCAVEDSGPGIALEHLDRLFNSFFTTKESGMGMGLSICRSIVEVHGGRIAADNGSAHGGARFYFMLPAAECLTD